MLGYSFFERHNIISKAINIGLQSMKEKGEI